MKNKNYFKIIKFNRQPMSYEKDEIFTIFIRCLIKNNYF